MTKRSISDMRAAFGGNEKTGEQTAQFSNNYYPFWNMKPGQRAVIRFLADRNESNPRGFLVEKVSHNLTINGQKKTVPCLSMYGEDCPVCKVSQEYYKAKDDVNGKKYWRKKQYLAQAIVIEDPLPPDATTGETHQGQVRNIALGYQLYNIIKEAFASEDDPLECDPCDVEGGYDFIIKKTQQGEYSTYTMGTKFHSRQRSLTEQELTVAEDGAIDLTTLLPKNPGVEKVQAMLNADLNGDDYSDGQPARSAPTKPAMSKAPRDDNDDDLPFEPTNTVSRVQPTKTSEPSDDTPSSVNDMLAVIKARRQGK